MTQATVNLPDDVLAELEKVQADLAKKSLAATRADALRLVIARGIAAVRKDGLK